MGFSVWLYNAFMYTRALSRDTVFLSSLQVVKLMLSASQLAALLATDRPSENYRSDCINMGAFLIRIGFWGPLYYSYNKEPPSQYR